jgi:hypothetical protein
MLNIDTEKIFEHVVRHAQHLQALSQLYEDTLEQHVHNW